MVFVFAVVFGLCGCCVVLFCGVECCGLCIVCGVLCIVPGAVFIVHCASECV